MAPEIEGKPAIMSGRTVPVRQEDLEETESCLVRIQVDLEDICASDLLSSVSGGGDESSKDSKDDQLLLGSSKDPSAAPNDDAEKMRALANKLENVKFLNKFVLLKLRDILPRQKFTNEDVNSSLNLKRSRPLSPIHVPRVPGVYLGGDRLAGEVGKEEGSKVSLLLHPGGFDLSSPAAMGDMLPLKYIKTADNSKAAFQKPPSTIFMPTPKLGVPMDVSVAAGDVVKSSFPGITKPVVSSGHKSPKKRPSRSRRDRNRSRNKVVIVPEPVMQRLQPGDTSKIPEDGYLWRKYGNKPIKTASYKRGYYKCRHYKEVKCPATKIVQQTNDDPGTFQVCYKGEHTCKQQGNLQLTLGGSGRPGGGNPDTVSLADQMIGNRIAKNSSDGVEKEEMEKDELLENDSFWPSHENSSDSASDDLFAADNGEDDVESVRRTLEPSSPLRFEMPSSMIDHQIATGLDSNPGITADQVTVPPPSWATEDDTSCITGNGFKQEKYHAIDTSSECPDQLDDPLMNLDNQLDNQLLKMIGGGLWDHPSDINYWYHDVELPTAFFSCS